MPRFLFLLAVMFTICFSGSFNAAAEATTWKLDLQNAELSEVVRQISQITGKSYILAPGISKKITLSSPEPMDKAEVENLFNMVIEAQGLNLRRDGKIVRIEQPTEAKTSGQYIIIPLTHAKVENIIPLIERMIPAEGPGVYVTADRVSNAVLLYGPAESRTRIRNLVTTLDQQQAMHKSSDLFTLKYSDASKIAPVLAELFKGEADPTRAAPVIRADPLLNAIVVQASPQIVQQVEEMVKKMDVERSQVLIEAVIVEISGQLAKEIGIQIAAGDAAVDRGQATSTFQTSSSGTMLNLGSVLQALGLQSSITSNGGVNVLLGRRDVLSVLVQALSTSQYANLLSTPSIMTLDNEQAHIVVGQSVPFRTGTFTNDAGAQNPFTTISRQDVGITLTVLPRIHPDGSMRLQVKQEVSAIVDANLSGAADIITNKRTIETAVLAQDGQVVVLGGLMQDDTAESRGKVPVLGDVPVLGNLFKSNGGAYTKRNLLVFLRPTLVRGSSANETLSKTRFDKLKEVGAAVYADHADGEPVQNAVPPLPLRLPATDQKGLPAAWILD